MSFDLLRKFKVADSVFYFVFISLYGSLLAKGDMLTQDVDVKYEFFTTENETFFEIGLDGRIRKRNLQFRKVRLLVIDLRLLADEEVQLELELVKGQKKVLKDLRQKVLDTEKSWLEAIFASKESHGALNEKFGILKDEQASKIDEVLLPHQKERFDELKFRLSIRRKGLLQSMFTPKYRKVFALNRHQIVTLCEECAEIKAAILDQCQQLYSESVDSIVNVLNNDQKEIIESIKGRFVPVESSDLELFSYYLRRALDVKEGGREFPADVFESLGDRPMFDIGPSGRLQEREQVTHFTKLPSSFYYVELMSNEDVQSLLQLSDQQQLSSSLIFSETEERVRSVDNELFRSKDKDKFRSEFLLRKKAIYEDARRAIEVALSVKQRESLRKTAEQIEIARSGLLDALMHGRLGKKIKVSSAQSDELRLKAEKISEEIDSLSFEIENAIFDKVRENLTDEQNQKLDLLIGDKLKKCVPNVGLLIRQLPDPKKKSENKNAGEGLRL